MNDNISTVTINSTSLNVELTGLGKYKLYSIQVGGRTVVGLGNFSEPVFVRTEQDGTFCLSVSAKLMEAYHMLELAE